MLKSAGTCSAALFDSYYLLVSLVTLSEPRAGTTVPYGARGS